MDTKTNANLSIAMRIAKSGACPLGIACAISLTLIPFFLVSIPPLTDLPQHVLVGRMLTSLSDSTLGYDKYFSVHWRFTPNVIAHSLLSCLQLYTSPFMSAKIYLSIFVLSLFFGQAYFARSVGHDNPNLIALAALPLAFSWPVYMGFLPFIMTLPLFVILLGVWHSVENPWRRFIFLALLLILLFGFHIIGSSVGAFSLLVFSLLTYYQSHSNTPLAHTRPSRRYAKKHVIFDFLSIIPVLSLTLWFLAKEESSSLSTSFYPPFQAMKASIYYMVASLSKPMLLLGTFGLLSMALPILVFTLRKRASHSCSLPLLLLSTALGVISVVVPIKLGILWPAGPRVLPFAYLVAIPLLTLTSRGKKIFLAGVSCYLILACIFTTRDCLELDKRYRNFLSGLHHINYQSKILPIVVDPLKGSAHTDPFWAIASAYTVYRGGSHPYVFAYPYWKTGSALLRYRPEHEYPFAFLYGDSTNSSYQGVASYYDAVIVWGENQALQSQLTVELPLLFSKPPLYIYGKETPRLKN